MKPPVYLDVDPRSLRLPWSRRDGADPAKLARQISRFGNSIQGMPPVLVHRTSDGELRISDGVTRATRIAKLLPGTLIRVEVIGNLRVLGFKLVDRGRQTTMISTVRQELLQNLTDLSLYCPEMRFGQLILNLATLAGKDSAGAVWEAEDEEILAAAREQLAYFVEHRPAQTEAMLKE